MTNFEKIKQTMTIESLIEFIKMKGCKVMNNEEAMELITNAIQSRPMTIDLDKALSIAQKALLKQDVKRVVPKTDPMFGDIAMCCPNCSTTNIVNINGGYYKYCPQCGQKLDWSESD